MVAAHPTPDRAISIPATQDRATNARERYPRPPVLEALVDIQVEPRPELSFADLDAVMQDERAAYPVRQEVFFSSFLLNPVARTVAPEGNALHGYRYDTQPAGAVAQLRLNGLTFSRLAPYPRDGWDEWQPEARRLWAKYWDGTHPAGVTRIAVRYINQIRIPHSEFLPQHYFRTYPLLADELGSPITGFLLRAELPQADLEGATLVLSQGIVQGSEPGVLPVLLDLDASRVTDLPPESDALWREIGVLHERVNSAFEACITDATRELFR